MENKTLASRGMSQFTWRHLVRTYGEEFAAICVLPDAEYWKVVSERMQTQNTERDLINEIVPSEWAPTLAAARRMAARRDEGRDSK
ncbi:MAG: hypothetical protein HY736_11330 [Verrucomicrobia bacterium]|nr:hypothetical protein [Verrucomicrobiota bacterium]